MIRGEENKKRQNPNSRASGISNLYLYLYLCIDYRSGFEVAFGYRSVVGPTLLGRFVVD